MPHFLAVRGLRKKTPRGLGFLFAENLASELKDIKEVIYPGKNNETKGSVCEVHEKFSLQDLKAIRESFDLPKENPKRFELKSGAT